jgi:hypothetical protein
LIAIVPPDQLNLDTGSTRAVCVDIRQGEFVGIGIEHVP